MTSFTEKVERAERAICKLRCDGYDDPPCNPDERCIDPYEGCRALAMAAIAALEGVKE